MSIFYPNPGEDGTIVFDKDAKAKYLFMLQLKVPASSDQAMDLLDRVDAVISKNVGSVDFWHGEDAKQYLENYRSLSERFPDFVQKINDYATFINATVDAYEETAKQGSQSAGNLAS